MIGARFAFVRGYDIKFAVISVRGVRTVTWTAAYAASPNRLLRLSIVS